MKFQPSMAIYPREPNNMREMERPIYINVCQKLFTDALL
jgi:hypothetical protein